MFSHKGLDLLRHLISVLRFKKASENSEKSKGCFILIYKDQDQFEDVSHLTRSLMCMTMIKSVLFL